MRRLRAWMLRVLGVFRTGRQDGEFSDELESHLDLHAADLVRAGHTPAEARRLARIALGGTEHAKERYRDQRRAVALSDLGRDVRYGARSLLHSPGFLVAAVGTLALGIGGVAAMFAVVYAVLLKPLPYPEPDRLVRIGRQGTATSITRAEFDGIRAYRRTLSSIAAYRGAGERRIGSASDGVWVDALAVTTDFLQTLGVQPALGREFSDLETLPDAPQVAVISDRLWRTRFNAESSIVGRFIRVDDIGTVVVGVLPATYWFHDAADVLLPLRDSGSLTDLGSNTQVVARLGPGDSLRAAVSDLAGITSALVEKLPEEARASYPGVTAVPFQGWIVGDVSLNLWLLFGATGCLLLIAVANLGMLLLVRFTTRSREVAVRVALGATGFRLARQWLVESLLLTGTGAAAGLLLSRVLIGLLAVRLPLGNPGGPIRIDGTVQAFAVGIALLVAVVFTVVPIMMRGTVSPQTVLAAGGRGGSATRGQARLRALLVAGEIAISTALFVLAGLLLQSLYTLQREPLGFSAEGVTTFVTPLDDMEEAWIDTIARWTDGLAQAPAVSAVAMTTALPLTGQRNFPTQRVGVPEQSIGAMEVRVVSDRYFEILGIPVIQGRPFASGGAEAAPVAVVNETVARTWWPDRMSIGGRLRIGMYQGREFFDDPIREVIGVVRDTKTVRLHDPSRPTVFVLLDQASSEALSPASVAWLVRGDGSPALVERVRSAMERIAPGQRVLAVRPLEAIVDANVSRERVNAELFGAFGLVALVLVTLGLYGVVSYSVTQRTREFGVRLALGARASEVLLMVLRQGLAPIAGGLALGLGLAAALARTIQGLLFGVSPGDPATFMLVAAVFTAIAGTAMLVPALRAARVDPAGVLRAE